MFIFSFLKVSVVNWIGLQSRLRFGAICLIALFVALSDQETCASKQPATPLLYTRLQTPIVVAEFREFITASISFCQIISFALGHVALLLKACRPQVRRRSFPAWRAM